MTPSKQWWRRNPSRSDEAASRGREIFCVTTQKIFVTESFFASSPKRAFGVPKFARKFMGNSQLSTMTKPVMAVDLDDVLSGFMPALMRYHNGRYGTNLACENIHEYDFPKILGTTREGAVRELTEFALSGALDTLDVIHGANEAIELLNQYYILHVVTARHRASSDITWHWLEKHFPGMFVEVHFAEHLSEKHRQKGSICDEIGAVVVIDDSYENAVGCLSPERSVLLFDAPWNVEKETLPGMQRVFSWEQILKALFVELR